MKSKRYVVGASVEYRLWGGFAVEGNVLYRRRGASYDLLIPPSPEGSFTVDIRSRAHVLEIPVLGKYYFRREAKMQPFVFTGYSFRKAFMEDVNTYSNQTGNANYPPLATSSYHSDLQIGAAVGGGVQWKVGRLYLAPELRYTRWQGTRGDPITRKNQLDLLFGIRF